MIRRCLGFVSHFMNNPGCSALNHSVADCIIFSLFFLRFLFPIAAGMNKMGSIAPNKSVAVADPGVRHLVANHERTWDCGGESCPICVRLQVYAVQIVPWHKYLQWRSLFEWLVDSLYGLAIFCFWNNSFQIQSHANGKWIFVKL